MDRRLPLFLAETGELDSSKKKKEKKKISLTQKIRHTIKRPAAQTVMLYPAAASPRRKDRLSLLFIET